ncbi:sensor histidine kinase [Agromyces fucosus]|uniref:Sensor histidine kinase n=1 Tax=Agromyces fucosus TaxID=41985 RepID=A0A4Q2JSR5_9MICO|nr:histidine kinase [Agromyces fucosus]RXZ49350.1 sensor histidine kinase [Agromyces fucosus]
MTDAASGRSSAGTNQWRPGARALAAGSTGWFLAWIGRHTGLWMTVLWCTILLFAPAADLVGLVLDGAEPFRIALAVAFLVGAAATFAVAVAVGSRRRDAPLAVGALVLLAGIACASMGAFSWVTPLALPAIAAGVALHERVVLPVILAMSAFAGLLVGFVALDVFAGLGAALFVFLAGLGNFVVHRLVAVIAELDAAREELARAAVVHERVRFARDLHDLLGHSLSVIVVKAELARRLAHDDADAAAAHAADIETIGRQALADVRAAVTGYRDAGLALELERARLALVSSGRAVDIRNDAGPLPTATDELFGWVVREGSTNIMRHSTARRCRVTIEHVEGFDVIEISDDGRPASTPEPTPTPDGTGLRGLRERVAEANGELHAAHAADGFRIVVRVPTSDRLKGES